MPPQAKPFNYYDLLEACAQNGCPVCELTARDVRRFLDSHLYEYANTRDTHAAMRAGRGLCAVHSAQLADFGAGVLGVAILQAAVLDELLTLTAAPSIKSGRWFAKNASAADQLEPVGACMACEALTKAEAQHLHTLANYLTDPNLNAAYHASGGVCLPHFRLLLRAAPDGDVHALMVSMQRDIWARLKAELDSFADQYDVNHAAGQMGAEADSWRRALTVLSGKPEIFGTRAR